MLFHSFSFLALLIPTLLVYWLSPSQRLRLGALLVASMVFYAFHHWPSVFLLIGTIAVNYVAGRMLEVRRSRALLAGIVLFDLSLLFWFKYAAFVSSQLVRGAAAVGVELPIPAMSAWLPLGISFFTFQVIAYQVDVYRGTVAAERSVLVFGVFKSFFAQLIAGPIVRAQDFLPQLHKRVKFDPARIQHGLFLFFAGLSLKIGVADVLRQFSDTAFSDPGSLATNDAWFGVYAFAFQLFADFWGYSTMAVGLGELFCLALPINFDLPYASSSLQEFWRRWHITLSAWFRDYVYIPLGGNRSKPARNLVLTMIAAGIWHGAGWNFMLWGGLHGAWLALERRLKGPPAGHPARTREELAPNRDVHPERSGEAAKSKGQALRARLGHLARVILVFHGVCLLWVFFRAPGLDVALAYLDRLLLPPYRFNTAVPETLAIWLIGFALFQGALNRMMRKEHFHARPIWAQVALTFALLLLALAYSGQKYDFVYFAF